VTTYGRLAAAVGCGSARAVGQALRRNPFAPEVPCHRVVGTDGLVGGYFGEVAGVRVMEKIERLESEGVRLAEGRLAKGQSIWEFHED
jgi:methylated-DNA-[protein]-cysteine S-methyltransferase